MPSNPVIDAMMRRKSIRSYTDQQLADEVLHAIVRAGQQAPFAAQLGSLLLKRDINSNPFKAPILFTICVDVHRLEQVMAARGWQRRMSDILLLVLGIQDAAYMAENMVLAAESFGLGSCYLGRAPLMAQQIIQQYHLPPRVFPLVQLVMGYPADEPLPRPRYPMDFALFEDSYPQWTAGQVATAMARMDDGYLAQDYYRDLSAMIPLSEGRQEAFTYDDYSWTEHISRKVGQWGSDPQEILSQLAACGFHLEGTSENVESNPS